MAITLEAIRAAGGIVHSDGNIFFRDISMLQGLAGAAPAAVASLPAVLEQIAQGWDGCMYDAPGETLDIGADIRAAAKRLLAEQPAAVAGPALDVTLDEDQAGLLRDMLGDPAEYEEALTVRLIVCDGHSGHGLYVAQAEYQDEGAVLLTSLPAPAAPASPAVDAWLQPDDMAALQRFHETAEDDESYDIGKEAVARLCAFGCLQSHSFGRYSTTDFGDYLLDTWAGARTLPFTTAAERRDRAAQAKEGGAA